MDVTAALIVAAGSGSRMGGDAPKQYRPIGGKAVLAHAVDALGVHPRIDAVRVVIGEGQQEALAREGLGAGRRRLIIGGAERGRQRPRRAWRRSGRDGPGPRCRPPLLPAMTSSIGCSRRWHAEGASRCCRSPTRWRVPASLGDAGRPHRHLVRVQTPQAFPPLTPRRSLCAMERAPAPPTNRRCCAAGLRVALRRRRSDARKADHCRGLGAGRAMAGGAARAPHRHGLRRPCLCRRGAGHDGRDGPFPHDRGLAGHSDADVVLHAITDALLGAGRWATSASISRQAIRNGRAWTAASSCPSPRRWSARPAASIDHRRLHTVICEAPKVGPHRDAMRAASPKCCGFARALGQHQGNDHRAARLYRPARRHRRPGGGVDPNGSTERNRIGGPSSPPSWSPRRAAGDRGQPQGRPQDGGRRKLHRRAGQRGADRDPGLIGRVRGRLRHLFERGQDGRAERQPTTWSRHSARSASPPPGRWPRARWKHPAPMSRWPSPALPDRTADRSRSRSGPSCSPAPSAAGPDEIVADQKLFDAKEGAGIRRQAALCALELLMP